MKIMKKTLVSLLNWIPNKKDAQQYNLSIFRKIISGETILLTLVQMQASDCCIAHLLHPGVKIKFKNGHVVDGCQIVVT